MQCRLHAMIAGSKQAVHAGVAPTTAGSGLIAQESDLNSLPYRAVLRGWAFRPYSPLAILTGLTLRTVFHLTLRQTEGLISSILRLLGLDLAVPDHTTLSRRARRPKQRWPKEGPGPYRKFTLGCCQQAKLLKIRLRARARARIADETPACVCVRIAGNPVLHVSVSSSATISATSRRRAVSRACATPRCAACARAAASRLP